jgi:hypothetical protein
MAMDLMETLHRNRCLPRILIADDHAIFAEGLRVYLESDIYRYWIGRRR